MRYTKTMLCLANSRKYQGRCVAGKVYEAGVFGEWIRPVTARAWEAIDPADYVYANGGIPEVMDVMDISFLERRPRGCQTENQLIDPAIQWTRIGRATWDDLERGADSADSLWINGFQGTLGANDRIPADRADTLCGSLLLIRPVDLTAQVLTLPMPFGEQKRQVRVQFAYKDTPYNLVVTDLYIEARCQSKKNGEYPIAHAYLCVSLGEPVEGWRYKLVAAIITPNRVGLAT